MNKKLIFLTLLLFISFFYLKDTYAYSSADYINRQLCGNFEVSEFTSDGQIIQKTCHSNFDDGYISMINDGGENLVLLGGSPGNVKIYAANNALLDLTIVGNNTFYMYETLDLNDSSAKTYMTGNSSYGGADGVYLDTGYSHRANCFAVRLKVAGFEGWVRQGAVEIVPLVWVKSTSSYTVSDSTIKHNYITNVKDEYTGSRGTVIGPKPSMLEPGNYLSYDGNYFYKDLKTLVSDYKKATFENSVNKDKPYYNYYQYLPNHTKTTYSSVNFNDYIRNVLGYGRDIYGTTAKSSGGIATSRFYGQGTFFYNAQQVYGVNAALAFGVSRNETGNGRSNLAINKNNGFGLNAVDSAPGEHAFWYATFSSSIYGFANRYVTYGYSRPSDYRYFGNQYGNKDIGMNVKYASDIYWGEKMASHYYNLDVALGFQDHDFYQLGVTTIPTTAMSEPNYTSKGVYNYKSKNNSVVIIDEVEGQEVNGNNKWYKVMSDMNIDSNFNEIKTGPYNWNAYVYIPAAYVTKINEGKNGYIHPNEVTEYQDAKYTYDIYTDENNKLSPKVALSTKETLYYYDSSLTSPKGQSLVKNRYVMVYTTALNEFKEPVAYLVTSDYMYDQKHWVSADSIRFVTSKYARASVTVPDTNTYSLVNPTTVDSLENHISGLYTYAYTPILEETTVDGRLWYKVPVDLSGNKQEFGWTLSQDTDISLAVSTFTATNTPPVIKVNNQELLEGQDFDPTKNVIVHDQEDGTITDKLKVITNTVNTKIPGIYQVTYQVTDKDNYTITKTITVTVLKDEEPVITAKNIEMILGDAKPNLKKDVTALDKEDGTITDIKIDDSKVDYTKAGSYKVTYEVTDSFGHKVVKEITLLIKDDEPPVINVTDKTIPLNSEFKPLEGVTAYDKEDGELKDIKVTGEVKTDTLGTYKVTYEVTDSKNQTTTKTITITVGSKEEKEGTFYFDYLDKVDNKLELRGYLTLTGMDNTLNENITYKVIFTNTVDKTKTYEQQATRITDLTGINRPIYAADNHKYTHSWFSLSIDIDSLPIGNYTMEVQAEGPNTYSKALVVNKLYKTEVTSYSGKKNNVNIKNNYGDRTSAVTLYVRDKATPLKTVGSYYNQFDVWRTFEFTENKLHLKGASYSYGMDLSKSTKVERHIIFEDKETYKTYKYSLSSTINGLYNVALPEDDKLDKTRAWYDATIDISNLPKGEYKVYITTKSNLIDYSEFTDNLNRDLSDKKLTLDDKTYQFYLNKQAGNSIELKVS